MSLRKRIEDEDYYCLVQCNCGRKYIPEEMFICNFCKKIKCKFCLITEVGVFRCKGFCNEDISSTKKHILTCKKCLECPLCFTPLVQKFFNKKYYLFCNSCFWNSQNVHISKEKKEELDSYIGYLNQEQNNGFFKGMFDNIFNQLTQEDFFAGEIDNEPINNDDDTMGFNTDYDVVEKAMEKTEQTYEEFDKKYKKEINDNEKKISDKLEYNDDYLNINDENKDNRNKNFKLKTKLLPCYNDFNQNLNSLEEVKKAFISNNLSLNAMTSLEQKHNNVIFQNISVWNQYPKFIELIPRQKDYCKICKECKNYVAKIPENPNSENEAFSRSYISSLPLILINKIDWEQNVITLKFILINFILINISFKEDPYNSTKIILPQGKFKVEDEKGYKRKLIDFKFDEKHKDDFIKNNMYIFRFILVAEFKHDEVGELSSIEYPVEIKFK